MSVYSSLARARSMPSRRISLWSNASGWASAKSTGYQSASAASEPAWSSRFDGAEGEPGDGDDLLAGVASARPVGLELFEVDLVGLDAGLFAQFAQRGLFEGVVEAVAADEAAGQREPALERLVPALDQRDAQLLVADGEDHQVGGDPERRGTRAGGCCRSGLTNPL